MPPASRRIRLGTGIDYHILEWGGGDPALSHTVILVHGFLDLAWGWLPTVEAGLAEGLHIVAPDMRGHGDSGRIGAGGYYHFADYIADLHELVGQVARDRLSLVGHSMGGSICNMYTGTFPERVHRLALLEGIGPPVVDMPIPDRVRNWVASWADARTRPPKAYPTLEDAARRLQKNDPLLTDELALELARHGTVRAEGGGHRFKHDPVHLTLGPYPFQTQTAEQFWRRIRCPVLAIEAAESSFRFSAEETVRRYAAFATLRRVELPGAAHMMHRHQPKALAEILRGFLTAPDPADAA